MSPLRRVPVRKAPQRRFPNREDPAHLAVVRSLRCAIAGQHGTIERWVGIYPKRTEQINVLHVCSGPIQAHHVVTKAQGGHDRQTVPLCKEAHAEFHAMGRILFAERWGVDLVALAKQVSGR